MYNLQMTDIGRLGGAAAAEANGSSPIQTAKLRAQAHGLNTAELHAQADFMAQRWPLFLQQSFMNDKETQVKLYGPNGTFRTGTPSEAHSSKDKALVAQQLLKKHIQANGFYGKSPAFLTDALTKMSEGTNQIVAARMTQEVSLQRDQQIAKVETIFRSSDGTAPQRFHQAHGYLQNLDPGQQAAAIERLFTLMETTYQTIDGVSYGMSATDVEEILDSSFSHQPNQSIRTLYKGRVLQLLNKRQANDFELTRAEITQRDLAIKKYGIDLENMLIEDKGDGDDAISLDDQNIDEIRKQVTAMFGVQGNDINSMLEQWKDHTQQAVYEEPIVAMIKEQIEDGQITAPQILNYENLSKKTKRELIQEAVKADPANPTAGELKAFTTYATAALKRRSRANGDTATHESYFIMKEKALNDFTKRVRNYKLNDASTAANNATADFIQEFGELDTKGVYAINDFSAYTSQVQGQLLHSGVFSNYEKFLPQTITPETTALEIQRKIDTNPDALNTRLVSEGSLKKVIQQYRFGQTVDIIPQLEFIARKNNISYSDLLSRQMAQYEGLNPPKEIFSTAQKVEQAIPQQYRVFMRYPSATNTDKMLMSSGLPSLYNRNFLMSSEQTRALDVLHGYESSGPNLILNNDGGYNAMNQGGTDGGRTAINPGHSSKLLGRLLTDMTLREVMQAQKDGRLHAAGRYQFTNNTGTIDDTIKLAGGIPLEARFDERMQDFLALTLLRSRGITPWIGPVDKATPAERQLIESARTQPISFSASVWGQADNMNPELVKRKIAND